MEKKSMLHDLDANQIEIRVGNANGFPQIQVHDTSVDLEDDHRVPFTVTLTTRELDLNSDEALLEWLSTYFALMEKMGLGNMTAEQIKNSIRRLE